VKVRNQKYLIAFGEHLKALIDKYKVTPEAVASRGEIETKQVYRVINGEHSATLSVIYAIAKGLGVKPKVLFDFEFDE
jgi:transcriptional regulator with XRE-family HTH domain